VIYEIREYTAVPGRMPALVRRFNDHTLRLFERHGMEVAFISVTAVGDNSNNELVYLLRFDDLGDMERKWAAFQADRDWKQARRASEEDGPLVARISRRVLNPSPFGNA
jgi:hypothetical protein